MAAQSAVRGPWRVRTIEEGGGRDATARLLDDALLLEHEGGVSVVEFGALAGAEASGARAVLHHATVGTLVLETPQAALLVEALGDAACTIPELTANLRMMGTLRAKPGSDHDRWFGALLDARRHAHAATHPDDRVNAVDAAALRASHEETIEALSLARHPRRAPDRRAFAEELRDVSERYARALEGLSLAAAAMRRSSPAERFVRWHEWVEALRRAFTEADAAWEGALPVLADSRGGAGRLWRRVLKRGARDGREVRDTRNARRAGDPPGEGRT
ncbi:MAG: hypothetical protein HYX65_13270 [Gemmatimonadetes bacterium]|nr:hypothetical protein [Gemmatimonadota bacterium]